MASSGHIAKMALEDDAPAMGGRHPWPMHSEWIDGVILRPMMDAGYSAWRDGERLGVGRLIVDTIEVEADDPRVHELLHQRLAADARAAGIALRIEGSASASSPSESRISRALGRSTRHSAGEPKPARTTTSSSSTRAA